MNCIIIIAATLAAVDTSEIGPPLGEEDFRRGAEIDVNVPESDLSVLAEKAGQFEGDIVLNDEQRMMVENGIHPGETRSAITDSPRKKWPKVGNNVEVPYTITDEFDQEERAFIARGMDEYHKNTCIR